MSKEHLAKVDFDFIRYANCWEDADVLLEALQLSTESKVLSIASAGDNCFALLSRAPKQVIAFDISEVQLYLVELKKVAIQAFDRSTYLAFAGFTACENRIAYYEQIKAGLSEAAATYWEKSLDLIAKGIIHQGKFEKYFQLFKNEVLPTVHAQPIIAELFAQKSAQDQIAFHDQKWNTPAWVKMYRQFFGVEMMGTHGRDPEFLKYVKGNVPDIILEREKEHLRTTACQTNYFLHYILYNKFNENFLPFYVRAENYETIKANLNRLVLHKGLLENALVSYPDCTHFNLSDIFEYMPTKLFKEMSQKLIQFSAKNARFANWNLMLPRFISTHYPQEVSYLKTKANALKAKDLGYFYGDFVVEEKL